MEKTMQGKQNMKSYTIKGTEQDVKVGDRVLLESSKSDEPPYVAILEKLKFNKKRKVKFNVRWFYRPEDTSKGRKDHYGKNELFLSDHHDFDLNVDCIIRKCNVHSFKDYVNLDNVGDEDYFCRYKYKAKTEELMLDDLDGLCICGLPYNPADESMLQCYWCRFRYHPACVKRPLGNTRTRTCFYCCDKCYKKRSSQVEAVEDGDKGEHEAQKRMKIAPRN